MTANKKSIIPEGKRKKAFVYYLALWGCVSTGIVYSAVGVIAILSFLKLKKGGADEASLFAYLDQYLVGKILVWIIMLGMVSYIIWRIIETIRDPYGYGRQLKGIVKRTVTALSSFADAFIAHSTLMVLLDKGGMVKTGLPTAQREMADNMLQESWGQPLLMTVGIITAITAIVQLGYVISRTYMERLNIDHLVRWKRKAIHVLAWAGHCARGTILGIIGFFIIKAAVTENAEVIVNTDKAFDFLGDDIGHFSFIAIAIATICYGIFMFAFGLYYDTDKDLDIGRRHK